MQRSGHEGKQIIGFCLHEIWKDNFSYCCKCITNDNENLLDWHKNFCIGFKQIVVFIKKKYNYWLVQMKTSRLYNYFLRKSKIQYIKILRINQKGLRKIIKYYCEAKLD